MFAVLSEQFSLDCQAVCHTDTECIFCYVYLLRLAVYLCLCVHVCVSYYAYFGSYFRSLFLMFITLCFKMPVLKCLFKSV